MSPDGSDTVFNGQREYENQESPSHSLQKNLYRSIKIEDPLVAIRFITYLKVKFLYFLR